MLWRWMPLHKLFSLTIHLLGDIYKKTLNKCGARNVTSSSLISKNVTISGRRTSVRLEPELWNALINLSEEKGISLNQICTDVDDERGDVGGFTSALRVYIVSELSKMAARGQGAGAECEL